MVSIENTTPINSPLNNSYNLLNAPIKNSANVERPISESISPRRLDFSDISLSGFRMISDDEIRSLSPISLSNDEFETIGECGICYDKLPMYSNHIFTLCGHLFCVKCLLNWNNNSSTCPLCREKLYDNITVLSEDDYIDDDGVSINTFISDDDQTMEYT